jgi:hypothetical protein
MFMDEVHLTLSILVGARVGTDPCLIKRRPYDKHYPLQAVMGIA